MAILPNSSSTLYCQFNNQANKPSDKYTILQASSLVNETSSAIEHNYHANHLNEVTSIAVEKNFNTTLTYKDRRRMKIYKCHTAKY